MIGWWAVPTILEHGTPEQIERFVPATLRGEFIWCQLFTSRAPARTWPHCGPRPYATDGGWLLTGQKVWTSAAHKAHWGVCLARTDPDAPKHKGITYFLVDMSSPGIEIRPLREITGDSLFNEVFFDDVFVPDEMVVGTVNDGWRLARTTLANERVAMATGTALGNPMEELLEVLAEIDLDAAQQDRLGRLIVAAQTGALLDQRIAQLAVGGQDPGAAVQRPQTHRSALSAGAGRIHDGRVRRRRPRPQPRGVRLPEHPLPDDRRRHGADPAHRGRRATPRATSLAAKLPPWLWVRRSTAVFARSSTPPPWNGVCRSRWWGSKTSSCPTA